MRVYDVTVPLDAGTHVWDGEPGPELDKRVEIDEENPARLSAFSMGSHTGTHVDAPAHFEKDGATVEGIATAALVGPAVVVEHTGSDDITAADLDALGVDGRHRRVLFKTANGRLWSEPAFRRDFLAIAPSAAHRLVELGVQLVGMDYLSVEAFDSTSHEVHHALLGAGVVALEGVDLREAPPGEYLLVCAPLKLAGAEGAPARVFLIDERA
jgi:arylformamidase